MVNRQLEVLRILADGEWHSTAELSRADTGGTEGCRRVRELRRDGKQIDMRRRACSSQYEYRLRLRGA